MIAKEVAKIGVNSEYGQLESVLVRSPKAVDQEEVLPFDGVHPLLDSLPISPMEAGKEHDAMMEHLAEVVPKGGIKEIGSLLHNFLEETDARQRSRFLFDALGTETYTHYMQDLGDRGVALGNYSANDLYFDLMSGYPRPEDLVDGEVPPQILPPRRTLYFTRDPIAVTPIGFMIGSMAKARRMHEPAFMKGLLKHLPDFGEETIAVDLPALEKRDGERYILEGGNVQVYDKILAIGMGEPDAEYANRTNAAGAEAATRELFAADKEGKIEQIVHVYIPDLPINIHLDSIFNMFGPKTAVAMPYVFGYPEKPEKYVKPLMDRLRADMLAAGEDPSRLPKDTDYAKWGTAKVYTRESLAKATDFESAGEKVNFFDYLVEQGQLDLDNICWVGGELKDCVGPIRHLMRAFQEQNSLGANVFAVEPYRAIAYERNRKTIWGMRVKLAKLALKPEVLTIPSNELRTTWGGPHCMAMPLSRKPA